MARGTKQIMNILAIASVEDDTNIRKQIAKQTYQPNSLFIHVDKKPAKHMNERRKRIAENQSILAEKVREIKPDYVWQVEGDGDYPEDTLSMLVSDLKELDDAAYVSGIEVGRHGLYVLGAWTDITDESFNSLDYRLEGIQEVDATGFYCLLARTDAWLQGEASWNGEPYGPDVVWGLSLKQKGYKIYCDMRVKVGHIIKNNDIIRVEHPSTCNAKFYKEGKDGKWKYKQL